MQRKLTPTEAVSTPWYNTCYIFNQSLRFVSSTFSSTSDNEGCRSADSSEEDLWLVATKFKFCVAEEGETHMSHPQISFLSDQAVVKQFKLKYRITSFLHYDANLHISSRVRRYLNRQFPKRIIGRNAAVRWPSHNTYLHLLKFYLKLLVFFQEIHNVKEFRQRIFYSENTIIKTSSCMWTSAK